MGHRANYTALFFQAQIYLLTITYVTSGVVAAGDTVICKTRHGSWFPKTCDLEITTHIKQSHILQTHILQSHILHTHLLQTTVNS